MCLACVSLVGEIESANKSSIPLEDSIPANAWPVFTKVHFLFIPEGGSVLR